MGFQLVVGGQWLEAHTAWGDLEWSTVWPGGSDSLTFGVTRQHRVLRPDAVVELYAGGECLWCGTLVDPTRGGQLVAEGLFRKAEDYTALSYAGEAILNAGGAVDAAIYRGMPWKDIPIYEGAGLIDPPSGTVALDANQPHSVAQLLDASARERGHDWGVDPYRRVWMRPWPTTPAFHMAPGLEGLGISRDGYASVLWSRYLDSTANVFYTRGWEDQEATARWGRVERTIAAPLAEGAPITGQQADDLLKGLLAQGRSQIGWTSALEVQYGDVVTEHGGSVSLHRVAAGQVIRLHGLVDDVADLAGQTWTDVPIARVTHKDGVATIEPRKLVSPMNDVLAGVAS